MADEPIRTPHGPRVDLPDVNVLIALTNPSHVHHARAHDWLAGATRWATTSLTESAFVRLMLNPVVAGRVVGAGEVLGVLAGLRSQPGHTFLVDDGSLADPVIDLVGLVGHRQVTDLHLVDLAARHGHVLVTFDRAIATTLAPGDREHCRLL